MTRVGKTWSRVIFKINQCTGRIHKKFDPKTLHHKLKLNEAVSIFNYIELQTNHFSIIRSITKIKIFLFISITFLIVLFIVSLCVLKNENLAIIFAVSSIVLSLLLFLLTTILFKKFTRGIHKTLHEKTCNINESILIKKRLYMVPDNNFKYISIYIIPLGINLSVLIHNLMSSTNDSDLKEKNEKPLSFQELINVNKRRSIFTAKYTNFKNNYITGVNG